MGNKILVVGNRSYSRPIDDFGEVVGSHLDFFKSPEDFKLVMFTGGEDVSPEMYGDKSPKGLCWSNQRRDALEFKIAELAFKSSILMTGICRGIQFLNVFAGGRMMHDISGHAGSVHTVRLRSDRTLLVNSTHHQMIIPPNGAHVVGWADPSLSTEYIGKNDEPENYRGRENEIVVYPEIKAFGVQYHPETMSKLSEGFGYYRIMVHDALHKEWLDFMDAYIKGVEDAGTVEVRKFNSSAS